MKGKLYYRWESELTPEEICARIRTLGPAKDPKQESKRARRRHKGNPPYWYKLAERSNETDFRLYEFPMAGWGQFGIIHFSGTICESEGKTTIRGTFVNPNSVVFTALFGVGMLKPLAWVIHGIIPVKTFAKLALSLALFLAVILFVFDLCIGGWKKNTIDLIENNLLKR